MQMCLKNSIVCVMSTVVLLGTGAEASANLALSLNPNATISTLSAQLIQKPRSAAGNKVNVWDCDPPDALQGMHYFAYNIGPTFNPMPGGGEAITLRGFEPGPGYSVVVDVLVRTGSNQTAFLTFDSGQQLNFAVGTEVGLARVSFIATGAARGQIEPADDINEIDYDAKDINGNFTNARGVEHVRFTTE